MVREECPVLFALNIYYLSHYHISSFHLRFQHIFGPTTDSAASRDELTFFVWVDCWTLTLNLDKHDLITFSNSHILSNKTYSLFYH